MRAVPAETSKRDRRAVPTVPRQRAQLPLVRVRQWRLGRLRLQRRRVAESGARPRSAPAGHRRLERRPGIERQLHLPRRRPGRRLPRGRRNERRRVRRSERRDRRQLRLQHRRHGRGRRHRFGRLDRPLRRRALVPHRRRRDRDAGRTRVRVRRQPRVWSPRSSPTSSATRSGSITPAATGRTARSRRSTTRSCAPKPTTTGAARDWATTIGSRSRCSTRAVAAARVAVAAVAAGCGRRSRRAEQRHRDGDLAHPGARHLAGQQRRSAASAFSSRRRAGSATPAWSAPTPPNSWSADSASGSTVRFRVAAERRGASSGYSEEVTRRGRCRPGAASCPLRLFEKELQLRAVEVRLDQERVVPLERVHRHPHVLDPGLFERQLEP